MHQASPSSSVEAQRSLRIGGPRSTEEWLVLYKSQPNVLIEGQECRVEETIIALTPHLKPLAQCWEPGSPFEISEGRAGSLTLRSVEQLNDADQHRLLRWLRDSDPEAVQVISTTHVNLYKRVCQGLFLRDPFYYF